MIAVNFRNFPLAQNIRIDHNGIVISLVGEYPNREKCISHMHGMRLFRDGVDITHLHPAAMEHCDVDVDVFSDVLETIKIIDDGWFDKDIITLTDEVKGGDTYNE